MRRLETPARGRSMVHMIKTLGERIAVDRPVDEKPAAVFERPVPPLPPTTLQPLQPTTIKQLQRR
jgi:hypothetical protein